MATAALPRRDEAARARLREVAGRARPLTLARDRLLPVTEPLDTLLPGGGLRRGTVVSVEGTGATGATSLACTLVAAATAQGEWAAAVSLGSARGSLGMEAASEAGVALERFPVVRGVTPDRWATVVAALLDGITLVLAEVPRHVRLGDVRRLVARTRERDGVLVALPEPGATWAGDAAVRIVSEGGPWTGATRGVAPLVGRALQVRVGGKGAAARDRVGALAQAG